MVAAPDYTVDGLVTSLKNKYTMPTSQNLFQDADIVSLIDEEMRSYIIPLVSGMREDYWTSNVDQPITGTSSYTIPVRAAGGMLRDVVFVDAAGNEIEMSRLSPAQIKATFPFGYQLPLYTFGFYLRNDQVVPYPQQSVNATAYTLRMKILRRPNNLTLSSNCGRITVIASNVLTLSSVDPTWTTSTLFDIIQNFPQFVSISDNTAISNVNVGASQITLSTVPTGLAVGMWVCPQYTTCVPQVPYEAWPLLVQRGVVALARSLGDSQGTDLGKKDYEEMAQKFTNLAQPRVQLTAKKIVNKNSPYHWGSMGTPFLR